MRILISAAASLFLLLSPSSIWSFHPHALHNTASTFRSSRNTLQTRLFASTLDKIDTRNTSNDGKNDNDSTTTKAQSMPKMVNAKDAAEVKNNFQQRAAKEAASNAEESISKKRQPQISITEKIANSGAASAAAMATAAVNAAVAMKTLEAPDVHKSYISIDTRTIEQDEDGLPLTYDKDLISKYWQKERGALNKRWAYFVSKAVPFLTKLTTLFITEGKIDDRHIPSLSRQARLDLQDLGPTFIKAGQMMSVRPDVLPQATLDELSKLQDSVVPFDTAIAVKQIERELGAPLGQFFTSISEEPVAAASLAQVYLATLNDGMNTRVAVKVQRPDVLSIVSKDLYVLRRAAEVFQGLVER